MNKFCILAAGRGTRNTDVPGLHKALLPLENKPIISHIIDKLDSNVEIVIALGYKANQIKSYLTSIHSDRKFIFVTVDNFDKKGSGPGYSLLCCKSNLQEPFVFTSVDTLYECDIDIMSIDEDWMGTSTVPIEESVNYCLVKGSKYLDSLYFGTGTKAYIGMAGIKDYKGYWKALEEHKMIKDEYQVIHGFDGLKNIKLLDIKWYDTGNDEAYKKVRKVFNKDIVANKSDEVLFIEKNKVVKYFEDESRNNVRVERVNYLNGNTPDILKLNENMYQYDFIDASLLSETCDEYALDSFLSFCQSQLWIKTFNKTKSFHDSCVLMYKQKTEKRTASLKGCELDKIKTINGVSVPPVESIISSINWNDIYNKAVPSLFHGDLQPENILYNKETSKFTLIDWREGFGSSVEVGDVYYDLSKLYHALAINGSIVLNRGYDYKINGDSAEISFQARSNLMYLMESLEKFTKNNGYCWNNVRILGSLHHLNICTLYDNFHNGDYGRFLFLYAKYLLTKKLREQI